MSNDPAPRGWQPLNLHPDRLLAAGPETLPIARALYGSVRELPITSPHGHVPAAWLAEDTPFADPTSLLITPDHYVNRLMHANGVSLADLGVAQDDFSADQARQAFRLLCSHWADYRGTPVRYWFEAVLGDIFGVTTVPSQSTADDIYDHIAECLATPEYRPRSLYQRFGIDVLATTDDPCEDLSAHRALRDDPDWAGRVLPTFRPDRYLEPASPTWNADLDRLADVSSIDTGSFAGFLAALENRRQYFKDHGAVSSDHSHVDAGTEILDDAAAERVFAAARNGTVEAEDATALRRHLVAEMARMACDDGLVMTIHPGIRRNHHQPTHQRFGADIGCDIGVQVEFTDSLRPLLNRYGTHPNLHFVIFTVDETVFSREVAPLAGFYPSVYAGAPWWFLDAPDAIRRYRSAVTETAGFAKTSGFIDDTRAFCSIPARHDMSRRLDAGYLAQLVAEHRLSEEEAADTLHDLVVTIPRKVFKL
jgi:glucuronate isomerase